MKQSETTIPWMLERQLRGEIERLQAALDSALGDKQIEDALAECRAANARLQAQINAILDDINGKDVGGLTLRDFVRELEYAVETQTNITLEPKASKLLLRLIHRLRAAR